MYHHIRSCENPELNEGEGELIGEAWMRFYCSTCEAYILLPYCKPHDRLAEEHTYQNMKIPVNCKTCSQSWNIYRPVRVG